MTHSEDDPLFDESTVELYERARRESRLPAKPDAEAVGALNELISVLQSAGALWARAAEAARDSDFRDRIEAEADAMTKQLATLAEMVRAFGGAPPAASDSGAAMPFSERDLDYASDDDAIRAGLDQNRAHRSELERRLAQRPGLPDEARAALLATGE